MKLNIDERLLPTIQKLLENIEADSPDVVLLEIVKQLRFKIKQNNVSRQ